MNTKLLIMLGLALIFNSSFSNDFNRSIQNDPSANKITRSSFNQPATGHKHKKSLLTQLKVGHDLKFASINPYFSYFELLDPKDLEFTITGEDNPEIEMIECRVESFIDGEKQLIFLTENTDYTLTGNDLVIKKEFFLSNNFQQFQYLEFTVYFKSDYEAWFDVGIIGSEDPYLFPGEREYDLFNPGDIHANIIYIFGDISIESVSNGETKLTEGTDYKVQGRWLFILDSYLNGIFQSSGQEANLTIDFTQGFSTTLTIKSIETAIKNATIDPTLVTLLNDGPDFTDINITWNDASKVESLKVLINTDYDVFTLDWPFFDVVDNGDGTGVLTIIFEPNSDVGDLKSAIKSKMHEKASEIDYVTIDIVFDAGAPALLLILFEYQYFEVFITTEPENGGYVIGATSYEPGEDVRLFAHPNPGFFFAEWRDDEGEILGSTNPLIFQMPAENVEVVAVFEEGAAETFLVTFDESPEGGYIQASYGSTFFPSGTQIAKGTGIDFFGAGNFTYILKHWVVNGIELTDENDNQFFYPDLQEDIHVSAVFEEFAMAAIFSNNPYFILQDPDDVVFNIFWGNQTSIKSVTYLGNNKNLISLQEGIDYTIDNNLLTIKAAFILSIDPEPYDVLNLMAEFSSGFTTWFSIMVIPSLNPMLYPSEAEYDLFNPGDIFTIVTHFQPAQVVSISQGDQTLVKDQDYTLQGPWIFFKEAYLSTQLTAAGQELELSVHTDLKDDGLPFTIRSVDTQTKNAVVSPRFIDYIGDGPEYQDLTITWNDASDVVGFQIIVSSPFGTETIDWPFYTVTDNGDGTANLRVFFDDTKLNRVKSFVKDDNEFILYAVFVITFDKGAPAHVFITITFQEFDVLVSVEPENSGSVNGAYSYESGEQVSLEAIANEGFEFLHWKTPEGVVVSTSNPFEFKMPGEDLYLIAVFIATGTTTFTLTLEANPAEAGTVSGGGKFPEGQSVSISAKANSGFEFVNWTDQEGNEIAATSSFTFDMPASDVLRKANFRIVEEPTYSVTFSITFNDAPVENVRVVFNGEEKYTDDQGKATFENIPDGNHSFIATHVDYIEIQQSVTVSGDNVMVPVALISTGLNDPGQLTVNIFPNPFRDELYIESNRTIKTVRVTNITGQVVFNKEVTASERVIQTDAIHTGVYFVTLIHEDGEKVMRKLVKQ